MSLLDVAIHSLKSNNFVAVTGSSGSGKSTLLKELLHHLRDNTNLSIAYLPQQPHLFKASVRDNLSLFKESDDNSLIEALKKVALNLNLDDVPNGLSRGQLQRLGLARVLLHSTFSSPDSECQIPHFSAQRFLIPNSSFLIPNYFTRPSPLASQALHSSFLSPFSNSEFRIPNSSLIILDEPTASLDVVTREIIINVIKQLALNHKLIIATHDSELIATAKNVINIDLITDR